MQTCVWIGQPPTYQAAFELHGRSSSVVTIKKTTDKIKEAVGSNLAVNVCQSSFSMCEVIALSVAADHHTVLDCFGGVGSFAVCLAVHGIDSVTVEKDSRQARVIRERLTNLKGIATAGFAKSYRIPAADLISVQDAPVKAGQGGDYENPCGMVVLPYYPSGFFHSALSSASHRDILVRSRTFGA